MVYLKRSVNVLFKLMDLLLMLLPYGVAPCLAALLGLSSMGFDISTGKLISSGFCISTNHLRTSSCLELFA